jgi:UDPglucose 6-dehydrogenase/GDP-mannose 6-dehydrogenase
MNIAIVGSGYVGLVSGACLASVGHEVRCVDQLSDRVDQVRRGEPPFHEPGLPELLRRTLASGRLTATADLAGAVAASDVTLIAVGTPPRGEAPDLSFVEAAASGIGRALRGTSSYHVVVTKSTVPPGTTEAVGERIAAESGRSPGEFGLCMNPEFLREGHAVADFLHPDRIVIGQRDGRSGRVVADMYAAFDCPRLHTTLRNAELIKYASNSLLSVLISFSNELAGLCEALPGTDVDTVMTGLHLDRRLSPMAGDVRVRPGILDYLRAGIGFGGSCLPKDVNALRVFARERGVVTPLLDATVRVNTDRARRVIDQLERLLGGLSDRTIAVLGLAFKPGTDDLRESPAFALIRVLRERGARVRAFDPLAMEAARRAMGGTADYELSSSPEEALTGADGVLVATAWPEFTEWDWDALCRLMRRPVILDGRHALARVRLPGSAVYQVIGRSGPSADEGEEITREVRPADALKVEIAE